MLIVCIYVLVYLFILYASIIAIINLHHFNFGCDRLCFKFLTLSKIDLITDSTFIKKF